MFQELVIKRNLQSSRCLSLYNFRELRHPAAWCKIASSKRTNLPTVKVNASRFKTSPSGSFFRDLLLQSYIGSNYRAIFHCHRYNLCFALYMLHCIWNERHARFHFFKSPNASPGSPGSKTRANNCKCNWNIYRCLKEKDCGNRCW